MMWCRCGQLCHREAERGRERGLTATVTRLVRHRASALLHLGQDAVHVILVDFLSAHRGEQRVEQSLQFAVAWVLAHQTANASHGAREAIVQIDHRQGVGTRSRVGGVRRVADREQVSIQL